MKHLRICAWAVILFVTLLNGCARSPQARRDKFLKSGKALLEKKDYTRALLQFRNAVQAMPHDAESYYQLGIAALQAGDIRTGALSVKKAVELNPKDARYQLKFAELKALGDENLVREAEASLKELRNTAPVTPEMLNTLALTELRLGEKADAVQILEQLLAKNPGELNSAVLMARARLADRDPNGAEQVLRKAALAAPRSAQPRVTLGEFYRGINRPADAETEFRAALSLEPNNSSALYSLAGVLYGLGRMQEVEAIFQRLANLHDSPYQSTYALFLLRQGRRDEAVREFERLAKQAPDDRGARTQLVAAYELVGRAADAHKLIDEALHRNPNDIDALTQRAELSVRDRKYEQAEADLNRVLQLQPDSPQVHYSLAKLHQARSQDLSYRQELAKAVQLNPFLVNARLELAQSLIASNDARGALDLLNAVPESQKSLIPVVVERNWALWAAGDLAEMRRGIDAGLSQQKSSVDLLLQDGMWKLRSGNAAGARTSLEEALKIDPDDVRALSVLQQSYALQNKTGEALDKVKEYAAHEPRSAPVQNFLGTLLFIRGDRAGARAAFQRAKAADPHSVKADMSLIQLDVADNKLDDARQALHKLLSSDANNRTAHLWLANLDLAKEDYGPAQEEFRVVLSSDPDNPQALNNLAYLLARQGKQPMEALKYAQRAKELAPNNPAYADTLGWIFYQQGLYPSAIRELESATSKKANPVWQYHLAMAYAKGGDSRRARTLLASALKENPNVAEARVAQQVISGTSASDAKVP